MGPVTDKFWETVPLAQLDRAQWEALCDGCGKCCLNKLEYEDTGEVVSISRNEVLLERDSAIKVDNGDEITIDFRDNDLNPAEHAVRNQKIEIMRHVVSRLPDKYQRLVSLRYFDELSYEEIATELKAPLGTVKAQLHRARELLYDMVKHTKQII